ncbi:hypothetical protein CGLAUT_08180 [Corynebacterium glaucum]|uniref:hypothetical protein n=1 Tax=Corynebacterium glaucum TaxID=187491 RepID=UPI0025B38D64|nr:hypothetical protein [Corynebacterium glaucum]WJZ08117.1 hypothetical protein CGLAUT_08180 [Corynebacterium glaucum]
MRRLATALAAALGIILVVAGVYVVGLRTQPHAPTLQGDTLGRNQGESWEEYASRTKPSISESSSFALVTFDTPRRAEEAAAIVREVRRVNALLLIDAPFQPIPEPTTGQNRADVFQREAERLAAQGRANGIQLDPEAIAAVVVYDNGATLRALADAEGVRALEALPPDAVWGSFAIWPVN